jgi:hypothetical protein
MVSVSSARGAAVLQLYHRVKDEEADRLAELFGPVHNPKFGAYRRDNLWENLRRLGDKAFGGGRWLP